VSFAQAPPSIVEADRLEPAGLALPAGQVLELHLVAQVRGARRRVRRIVGEVVERLGVELEQRVGASSGRSLR
jgi:hypothetical protein